MVLILSQNMINNKKNYLTNARVSILLLTLGAVHEKLPLSSQTGLF